MDDDWTKNHNEACHFARKQDAEQVIAYYGWTAAKAIEHCWPKDAGMSDVAERRGTYTLIKVVERDALNARIEALETALREIAAMDPKSIRADDLGRAARIARTALDKEARE